MNDGDPIIKPEISPPKCSMFPGMIFFPTFASPLMKTLITTLLLLSLCKLHAQNYCTAQPYKSHLQVENTSGQVKEIRDSFWRQERHYGDSVYFTPKLEYVMVYRYNTQGNLVQRVQYRSDSSVAAIYGNTYDSIQRVKTHSHLWPENPAAVSTCTCSYNEAGYAVKELTTMYGGTHLVSETRISYDAKGRLVKKSTVIPGLQDTITYRMEYDAKGRLAAANYTEHMGKRKDWSKTTYTYNAQGRTKEEKNLYKNDQTLNVYDYDQYGNQVLLLHYEGKAKKLDFTETTVYTYDSHHNWTKKDIHRVESEGYTYDRSVVRVIEYY